MEPLLLSLAVDFLEPISGIGRLSFTTSRLAVLADGTTVPVLHLLARQKFGEWSASRFPFWVDGNFRNETLANVDLAAKPVLRYRKLGLRTGPDYRKRRRQLLKERGEE